MTPEQIKKIHALILRELDIEDMPPTVQEKIIAEVGQNIFMATQIALLQALPESEHAPYQKLIEEGKPEEAATLLAKHIPDLDTFVTSVAAKTLTEFKALEAAQT